MADDRLIRIVKHEIALLVDRDSTISREFRLGMVSGLSRSLSLLALTNKEIDGIIYLLGPEKTGDF